MCAPFRFWLEPTHRARKYPYLVTLAECSNGEVYAASYPSILWRLEAAAGTVTPIGELRIDGSRAPGSTTSMACEHSGAIVFSQRVPGGGLLARARRSDLMSAATIRAIDKDIVDELAQSPSGVLYGLISEYRETGPPLAQLLVTLDSQTGALRPVGGPERTLRPTTNLSFRDDQLYGISDGFVVRINPQGGQTDLMRAIRWP